MKKFLISILALFLSTTVCNAESINKVLNKSGINQSAVSISLKDVNSGKTLYEHNAQKPLNPASTLKVVTLAASLNELGEDYNFETVLYKNTNNELILKLSADPFLTAYHLRRMLRTAKSKNIYEPKAFIIDESIIDNTEWGEGWQWDDDLNPLMPKFSAYNLDGNLLTLVIDPTRKGTPADLQLTVFYPTTFVNQVVTGDTTKINLNRNNSIAPDVLNVEGTVCARHQISFPVNFPKRYFIIQLEDAIRSAKIGYYNKITFGKTPDKNIYVVDKVTTPITSAISSILKDSNNLVAETVFKIAGGKYSNSTGTTADAIKMAELYLQKLGVNTDDIRIVDGSGVSKNNLVTADFMTDFLIAQNKANPKYKDYFSSAGQGTLRNRMLYFGDNLKAKTGTLADVSSITGYITTLNGKTLAFDIIINDAKSKPSEKKMLEEYILRAIQTLY